MKITHETADGIVVALEQVEFKNRHVTAYIVSSSFADSRWGYGLGDTECFESLHGYKPFHLLAEKFLDWQKRGSK